MKQLMISLIFLTLFTSCETSKPRILLFITDGSRDLELMLEKEALVMLEILENSNFEVVVTSLSGEPIITDSLTIQPDLKLGDVDIADFSGFIFPCMAPPWETIHDPSPEVVAFIRKILEEGKPMAAQTLAVAYFAKAGALVGKEYAFTLNPDTNDYPYFKGGLYSGEGVVQDGIIISSGTCPWKTREYGKPDGTKELTQLLVKVIND